MSDLYGYTNVVTGDTFVFAAEQPDLDARPNFERVTDLSDVPQYLKDAALRELAAAQSIKQAGETRESLQTVNGQDSGEANPAAAVLGDASSMTGVFQVATGGKKAAGGVLSRGRVVSPLTQTELIEKAAADTEALSLHGVLQDNLDGSQVRTGLGTGTPVADVANAEPVGDPKALARKAKTSRTKNAVTEPVRPAKEAPQGQQVKPRSDEKPSA